MNNDIHSYIALKYGKVEVTDAYMRSLPEDLCVYIVSKRYPAYVNEIVDGNNPKEVLSGLVEYDYLYSANSSNEDHCSSIRTHIEELIVEYVQKQNFVDEP